MFAIHFIVTEAPNEKEPIMTLYQDPIHDSNGCFICPLHIVQKERQRYFRRTGDDLHESTQQVV
jgi:hypothetical protein